MLKRLLTVAAILALGWEIALVAPAQEPGGRGGRGGPDGRRGRGPFGRGFEDPERFFDFMMDRYLENFTDLYELSAFQQEEVRGRLEELRADQRKYSDSVREEREKLHQAMRELWEKRRAGEEIDEQHQDEIMDQMRKIHDNSPFSPDRVVGEINKMLPAEQALKGYQKWQAQRREWDRRRDEMRSRGGRWFGSDGPFGSGDPFGSGSTDPWDRYAERFIRRYELDASQQATVWSLIRDFKTQRDAYRQGHEADFDAARQIEDRSERGRKLAALNEPAEKIFDELRTRLDKIPTSAQKATAEESRESPRGRRSTSQPARAVSQPAS